MIRFWLKSNQTLGEGGGVKNKNYQILTKKKKKKLNILYKFQNMIVFCNARMFIVILFLYNVTWIIIIRIVTLILSWSPFLVLSWFLSRVEMRCFGHFLVVCFLSCCFGGEYRFSIAISNPNAKVLIALLSVLSSFNRYMLL